METSFKYYAFISYKHEDVKWAKWLKNKLESYKLPALLRKEIPHLPKRINPVFRDTDNLGTGILPEILRDELEKSRYLIVICSPQSVQSGWVGLEITEFAKMGRARHIIPFIVEGKPNSNDERECLHPAIKKEIPDMKGININEIGKYKAFIILAATLLGLDFNAIWKPDVWRRRKQKIIAAVAGLLILVGTYNIWDSFFRTKIEYYADYVDNKGIPEGIIQLSKAEMQKRYSHYRFESRYKKLRRVVYANSAGMPINNQNTEYTDRFAIQSFIYKDNEKILSDTELKNAQGKTIATYSWSGRNFDRIDIKQDLEGGDDAVLASSFTSMSNFLVQSEQFLNKADINRFKLTRNDDGYIIRKEFMQYNKPACDASGIWGFEYDLDKELGRIVELRYLGYSEEEYFPSPDKTGVMGRRYEYDEYGNIFWAEYFGKDKKPVLNEQLWASNIEVSDSDGNLIKSSCFGTDGNPCLNIAGFSKAEIKYDEHGNMTEYAYFGIDGKPCLNKEGIAKIKLDYDKYGNIKEAVSFGIDDNPCYNINGFAKWTAEYDKYDKYWNMTKQAYFGTDDNPCYTKEGYAKLIREYDKHGNIRMTVAFGPDGKACSTIEGFAQWKAEYDEQGNRMKEQAFFTTDGRLTLSRNDFAKVTLLYDDRGNVNEVVYYGIDDKPRKIRDGFAKFTREYDARGNIKKESYFEVDLKTLSMRREGYAEVVKDWEYFDSGITQEVTSFLGTDGKLRNNENEFAKMIQTYNEQGKLIEELYIGIDGIPRLCISGFAKTTIKYDARGNVIEQAYFDTDETTPCFNIEKFAKITMKYNEQGKVIEEEYFGIDGTLCLRKGGAAKMMVKYDERGNMIEQAYFDTDGVTPRFIDSGYAKMTWKYDELGFMTEEAYFGIEDNPVIKLEENCAKRIAKYDVYGNIVEMRYFGIDGMPRLNKDYIAKLTAIYDYLGNQTDLRGYGIYDELVATSITLLIVQAGDAAYQKGLRGEFLVLEYCDWEFGNTLFDLYTKTIPDNIENKKKLVIMDTAGQINQYEFDKGHTNLFFVPQPTIIEMFYNMESYYNEWKQRY
jgi:hypothetical protein